MNDRFFSARNPRRLMVFFGISTARNVKECHRSSRYRHAAALSLFYCRRITGGGIPASLCRATFEVMRHTGNAARFASVYVRFIRCKCQPVPVLTSLPRRVAIRVQPYHHASAPY